MEIQIIYLTSAPTMTTRQIKQDHHRQWCEVSFDLINVLWLAEKYCYLKHFPLLLTHAEYRYIFLQSK